MAKAKRRKARRARKVRAAKRNYAQELSQMRHERDNAVSAREYHAIETARSLSYKESQIQNAREAVAVKSGEVNGINSVLDRILPTPRIDLAKQCTEPVPCYTAGR